MRQRAFAIWTFNVHVNHPPSHGKVGLLGKLRRVPIRELTVSHPSVVGLF
jgi:hypothetical protein